ncbi:MAG: alpha/beta hydrolase [Azonexaceae bacterium]|nr:alpha/beta hydrolase [Azonexaceae bacterium]
MRQIVWWMWCWLILMPLGPVHAEAVPIGIVIMHGKWDKPTGHVSDFASAMERAGLLVVSSEMTWSGRRSYDAGVAAMENEINAAIGQLRQRGARTIILAGHSFGAAGAVRYASRHKVDGIVALAPGHYPEGNNFMNLTAASRSKAQALIDAGKPDETAWFDDPNNGGRLKQLKMSAQTYIDFFDPAGPMNFGNNAATVLPGTAVLWVVGQAEETGLRNMGGRVFERLPKSLAARQVEVPGGHLETPSNSASIALEWIRSLPPAER